MTNKKRGIYGRKNNAEQCRFYTEHKSSRTCQMGKSQAGKSQRAKGNASKPSTEKQTKAKRFDF